MLERNTIKLMKNLKNVHFVSDLYLGKVANPMPLRLPTAMSGIHFASFSSSLIPKMNAVNHTQ